MGNPIKAKTEPLTQWHPPLSAASLSTVIGASLGSLITYDLSQYAHPHHSLFSMGLTLTGAVAGAFFAEELGRYTHYTFHSPQNVKERQWAAQALFTASLATLAGTFVENFPTLATGSFSPNLVFYAQATAVSSFIFAKMHMSFFKTAVVVASYMWALQNYESLVFGLFTGSILIATANHVGSLLNKNFYINLNEHKTFACCSACFITAAATAQCIRPYLVVATLLLGTSLLKNICSTSSLFLKILAN